jgi:hypothetical protein
MLRKESNVDTKGAGGGGGGGLVLHRTKGAKEAE